MPANPNGTSNPNATITLFVLALLILTMGIMYLFTKLRKQNQVLEKMKQSNQQSLSDEDVIQLISQFMNSQQFQVYLQTKIASLIHFHLNQLLTNHLPPSSPPPTTTTTPP